MGQYYKYVKDVVWSLEEKRNSVDVPKDSKKKLETINEKEKDKKKMERNRTAERAFKKMEVKVGSTKTTEKKKTYDSEPDVKEEGDSVVIKGKGKEGKSINI